MIISELPAVFIYEHMLCCCCLIQRKSKWNEHFITISEKAISIYESLQSWKVRKDPIQYISFCKSMVFIWIFISYSVQRKELRIPFGLSKSKISLIEPINSFLDGRNVWFWWKYVNRHDNYQNWFSQPNYRKIHLSFNQ